MWFEQKFVIGIGLGVSGLLVISYQLECFCELLEPCSSKQE